MRNFLIRLLGGKPPGLDDAHDLSGTPDVEWCEIKFKPGYYPGRMRIELHPAAALPAIRSSRMHHWELPDGRVLLFRPFRPAPEPPVPEPIRRRRITRELIVEAIRDRGEFVVEADPSGAVRIWAVPELG